MNKLEQLHLKIITDAYLDSFDEGGHNEMNCDEAASKSAEITEQIAIEFAEWIFNLDNDVVLGTPKKIAFQEFLKTKQ